jgi:hypothetical protein
LIYTARVIGVCVALRVASIEDTTASAFSYNSGLSVVVPIGYGLALLRKHLEGAAGELSPTPYAN